MGTGDRCVVLAGVLGVVLWASPPVYSQATDENGSIVTEQWLALGPFAVTRTRVVSSTSPMES